MSFTSRRPAPAVIAFAAALAGAGVLLLVWLSDLTFWRDEWGFLLHRRGGSPDVFLEPHYEHIAISLVAAYKALLGLFGMDSPRPFQVLATLTFLTSIALMFVYVRRRVGPWLALAAALPILVLGPAWDDLLWPFQLGFFASMSAGLGALLAVERGDRLGDGLACLLLVLSISFSSLGLPFAIGAAVHVAWDPQRLRRAYVAAVPLAIYGLWWLGWGHEADNSASLENLATLPGYVLDGFASSASSLLGLASPGNVVASPLDWGRATFTAVAALAIWRLWRLGGVWRSLCVVTAIAVSFWALAALNASIFREPTAGRYQYMGAIFLVLIGAELWRGARVRRPAAIAAIVIALLAGLSNVEQLHRGYVALTGFARAQLGGLAALELSRNVVDPALVLTEENSGVDYLGFLDAGSYLSAVDEFGSPAYTPAELAASAEDARVAADKVFAAAHDLRLEPSVGATAGACEELALAREPVAVEFGTPGAEVRVLGAGRTEIGLRRYASETFPLDLGELDAGDGARLEIAGDRSSEPWQLGLRGSGRIVVCDLEDG